MPELVCYCIVLNMGIHTILHISPMVGVTLYILHVQNNYLIEWDFCVM